jgi:hypothetical protein
MVLLATVLVCGLIGLILPGYLLSKILGDRQAAIGTGLVASIVLLFSVIFWMEVAGLRITPARVFGVEIGLSLILAFVWWVGASKISTPSNDISPDWRSKGMKSLGACAIGAAIFSSAVFLLRAWLWPLSGDDVPFRWEFLAARILESEGFKFYPPITAEHFKHYFHTDGIPPAVSFVYWWTYGTAGRSEPWLTCWFVTAQYVAAMFFTYALASRLGTPRTGWIALAMLACSSRFSNNVLIGQESGLLTLSLVAVVYHVVAGCQEKHWQHFVLAGLAAGLGALSREYGWAILLIGVGTLIWFKGSLRNTVVLSATTVAVAGPWYARNWILTGNPFYSNSFFGMPVNAMHVALIDHYVSMLGFKSWTMETWLSFAKHLLVGATWQVTLGIVAGLVYFRKFGFLTMAMIVVALLWVYSMPRTSGGAAYSTRVLCPAIPIASVLAALWVNDKSQSWQWVRFSWWVGFLILWPIGMLSTALFPGDISNLDSWRNVISERSAPTPWYERLVGRAPQGTRILTDNAYMHAYLYGKGIDIVPIWSPEVEFLMDPSISGLEARTRLQKMGIRLVVLSADLNGQYLTANIPLYRDDRKNWVVELTDSATFALFELPEPNDFGSPLIEHPPP